MRFFWPGRFSDSSGDIAGVEHWGADGDGLAGLSHPRHGGVAVLLYDWRSKVSLLNGAGLCAMLGFVLFYHRQYDNQMLFLLMLAATARVLQNGWRVLDMIVCGLLGLTLYVPAGMVAESGSLSFLAFVAPVAAAVLVLLPTQRAAEIVPPVQA